MAGRDHIFRNILFQKNGPKFYKKIIYIFPVKINEERRVYIKKSGRSELSLSVLCIPFCSCKYTRLQHSKYFYLGNFFYKSLSSDSVKQ